MNRFSMSVMPVYQKREKVKGASRIDERTLAIFGHKLQQIVFLWKIYCDTNAKLC